MSSPCIFRGNLTDSIWNSSTLQQSRKSMPWTPAHKRLWVLENGRWHVGWYNVLPPMSGEFLRQLKEEKRRMAQRPPTRRPLQEIQLTENPNDSNVDITNGVKIEDPIRASVESDRDFVEPPPPLEVLLGFNGDADAWQSFKVQSLLQTVTNFVSERCCQDTVCLGCNGSQDRPDLWSQLPVTNR